MQPQKLTNLQLELLKVFSYQLNQQQLTDIRNLLANYFAEQATREMDKLWEQQEWDENMMVEWANEHMRISHNFARSQAPAWERGPRRSGFTCKAHS
ncbi:MAG: hypothetical protein WCI11_00780 [Candidatus Methylumidiphilus sp.]